MGEPSPNHDTRPAHRAYFSQWDASRGLTGACPLGNALPVPCHSHERDKAGVARWPQKEEERHVEQSQTAPAQSRAEPANPDPQPGSVDRHPAFPHKCDRVPPRSTQCSANWLDRKHASNERLYATEVL